MKPSYVFLAEGFEEIEALTVVDVLRRAGMEVRTVSITPLRNVRGAHGIEVVVDDVFAEAELSGAEWLICPGGLPGASNLAAFEPLCDALKAHRRGIAAICAAPAVVLAPLGLVDGHRSADPRRRRCPRSRRRYAHHLRQITPALPPGGICNPAAIIGRFVIG